MIGRKYRRVVSSLLAFVFAVTLFPVSAFAVFDENARIYVYHMVDDRGASSEIYNKLNPTTKIAGTEDPQWYASAESIDLWVYSTDMTEDGGNDGNHIPYVKDSQGNTYYLQKIEWRNSTSGSAETGTIMNSDDITRAANEETKQYSFEPSTITADPESTGYTDYDENWSPITITYTAYYIYYHWTSTPPDQWSGDVKPLPTYW